MVLYSAVSSPLDRSKRFTLSSPGRPVHSDTVLGFSWKHSSHAAIAQRLFTHISTTVYSQVLKFRLASRALFLSLRHPVCFCCSCFGINHTAPQGSILGTDFPVGDINVEPCEGLLRGILEAFLLPTKAGERHQELTI